MSEFIKFANNHRGVDTTTEYLLREENINDYQMQAWEFAKYPEAGTGSAYALAYTALGLGEAGEVQGKVKKILRDSGGVVTDEVKKEIMKELGDVLWYVSATAYELGYTMDEVAEENLQKLKSRAERGMLGGSGDNR